MATRFTGNRLQLGTNTIYNYLMVYFDIVTIASRVGVSVKNVTFRYTRFRIHIVNHHN